MKISYNWLKEYLKTAIHPDDLSTILTNVGLEVEDVEEWESVPGGLKGVVIGRVASCMRHPEADRLSVTTVDLGDGIPLQIVCGAPNVAAGQMVPVATVGTIVYKGDEQLEIKRSKIRGQLSEGMICAEDELGIGSSHEGIMILDPSAKPGTPAAEYFRIEKDTVYTIGLTPNRIDSGSHFGVARDVAAFLNLQNPVRPVFPSVEPFGPDNANLTIPVEIANTNDCRRYTGITISGVQVAESPEWLRNRLRAVGQNPINNIVDITNFVLLEMGQPLHAFDADKIEGGRVIVRNLPSKTRFKTLEGTERELSNNDLMICNVSGPMCIAGVFGGLDSGVTHLTKNIFLESAWFNPVSVRRTSKRHGLHTDASFRFERGADINITVTALKRAAMLIKEIAGGKISSEITDVYPVRAEERVVSLTWRNIDRLIGKKIDHDLIKKILISLDFVITDEPSAGLTVSVPLYRVDVTREADVIEEILRIYGYNNVEPGEHLNSALTYVPKPDRERAMNTVADMLASNGFSEMMSNSLVPGAWFENNPDFTPDKLVRLANPLSSDLNSMRQSLLPGGLSAVAYNLNRQNMNLRLFEFGNCYTGDMGSDSVPSVSSFIEKQHLDLFLSGSVTTKNWNSGESPTDFFHAKSYVEMVMARMGIDPVRTIKDECKAGYYSESISYSVNNISVASAGKISRDYLNRFDIKQDVYHGHIEWDTVVGLLKNHVTEHKPLPKFPSVRRDLALLLDRNVRFEEIRKIALATERNLLREVGLFDVYEHESLGPGKKSYAVSFILRDDRRTLDEKSIEKVMSNLTRAFESSLGATIRR
jgi:phenylalanyl-tRNA synthetase beta chain